MSKLSTKEITEILETNFQFEPTNKTLYASLMGYPYAKDDDVTITKGLVEYQYRNFNEVVLWHRYYSSKYHNISTRTKEGYFGNASYFARIPYYYTNLAPKKGLNIVKEAMMIYIRKWNGIPNYYQEEALLEYFYVK